jgi:hypothetical protein
MKYYLTTPICYANAAPHIGQTHTTLATDAIRRFRRTQGSPALRRRLRRPLALLGNENPINLLRTSPAHAPN